MWGAFAASRQQEADDGYADALGVRLCSWSHSGVHVQRVCFVGMDQMCFNVPRLPHETHAVPARVVQKDRITCACLYLEEGMTLDGDGVERGGWANNVGVWWRS